MKFLNFNKILCLSPHPDDTEIGIIGSALKFFKTNFDVFCLSRGGSKNYDKTNTANRRAEVDKIWKFIKCENVSVFHSEYDYLEDNDNSGWVNYIENYFFIKDYDCIFVPSKEDSNIEHIIVNGFGAALSRFSPVSIIEYQTFSTLNSWIPNLFIDIENFYDIKKKSLIKFKSQNHKPYFQKKCLDSFHSNFQCCKKNFFHVEKFKINESFQ